MHLLSKKMFAAITVLSLSFLSASAVEKQYDYVFFDDSLIDGPYFYTLTDYSGKSWIENSRKHLPVSSSVFSSPGNSLMLKYISAGDSWRASVIYQKIRGIENFRTPDFLSLRLFPSENTDMEALPLVSLESKGGAKSKTLPLSTYAKSAKRGEWATVRIPLGDFCLEAEEESLPDLYYSIVFSEGKPCGKEITLYVDDIELLSSGIEAARVQKPEIVEAAGYERHIDLKWKQQAAEGVKYYVIYRSFDGRKFSPVAFRRPWTDRYTDFVGEVGKKVWYKVAAVDYSLNESPCSSTVSAKTRPMTDEQLLDMLQKANFRYYWEMAEPVSGLAREDVPGRTDMIAAGASGFGMMAIITGIHRGFISREQGAERFEKITAFLQGAERHHGVYSHFIDGTTGKTVAWFGAHDNGGDLVETSFMMQGLLCARQFFDGDSEREKTIRERIDSIWESVEWDWYRRTPDSPYLYWHWSPDQAWVINHKLIGWNETMITYLLAIMSPSHGVPASMYYSGWASQEEYAAEYRSGWGRVSDGDKYTNGNTYYGVKLDIGVSNGGPLFFTHYSFLGFDPRKFTDRYTNYYENNRNIAEINLRYCISNPSGYVGYGLDCWGLTASDHMWNYMAAEPVEDMDDGTVAPTGALASFPYTPEASMKAFLNYYRNYGSFAWGEYGFRDAFNLTENWVSPIFMGLNQAPVTVMVENYRSGFIWDLFMSHPDVARGLKELNSIK